MYITVLRHETTTRVGKIHRSDLLALLAQHVATDVYAMTDDELHDLLRAQTRTNPAVAETLNDWLDHVAPDAPQQQLEVAWAVLGDARAQPQHRIPVSPAEAGTL